MLQSITKEGNALLSAIRNSESSLDASAYNMRYSPTGGATFAGFADHPRILEPVPWRKDGLQSSAAGAFQITKTTWDGLVKKYGFKDFSPASQDKAAWYLAQDDYKSRTGRDLQADLETNNLKSVFSGLSGTWTSLPSGKESNKLTGKAYDAYNRALNGNGAVSAPALPSSVSTFYGSIRKAGCETRNAVLSAIPFFDYVNDDCEDELAAGTGVGFEGETPEEPTLMGGWFLRIGYGLLGITLLVVGFNKLKV